ncbi:hypothetical protein [Hydrogenophaga sp.]|uniref:hypothetical protein n=1 Tax=Hydrogenophaga sp. TaxID=1904254 RepID=UPI00272A8B62|nr:hypothetical protein [Hydrogenophaga sp.]
MEPQPEPLDGKSKVLTLASFEDFGVDPTRICWTQLLRHTEAQAEPQVERRDVSALPQEDIDPDTLFK